jgi:antitoxin ParD1/3/4
MTEHTPIALGDDFLDFVEAQVASGRFASASEVVRAGLRLLEDQERREAALAALFEGEASGPAEPFDFDAFLATMRAERA